MDISVFFWKQGKNAVPTLIAWQQDMELCRLTTVPSVILQTLGVVLTKAQGGILCFHFEETCSYMSRQETMVHLHMADDVDQMQNSM